MYETPTTFEQFVALADSLRGDPEFLAWLNAEFEKTLPRFDPDLWLSDECKARGCKVQSQYVIRNLADGIVHWHGEPGNVRYSALLVEGIVTAQNDPRMRAAIMERLEEIAHGPRAARRSEGHSIVWSEPPTVEVEFSPMHWRERVIDYSALRS